jgi:hypothetical protein
MRNVAHLALLFVVGLTCASGVACSSGDDDRGAQSDNPYSAALPAAPSRPSAPTATDARPFPTDAGASADASDGGTESGPVPIPPPGSGLGPGVDDTKPATTHKIKDLTGPGTSSETFGVGGTDLGIPVRQPNGKLAFIFGDTWQTDGIGGTGWRSPVLLRSEFGNLGGGITFTGAAGGKYAKQILNYQHNTAQWSTWLPSDVITIGNRMYLHFIVNKGLGNVQWTQIAYSDDNGENWTVTNTKFAADDDDSRRQVWTWARGEDGYVYIMSTKFISRDQAMIMYRVPETKILEHDAYEPWGEKNGKWAWGNPASVILDGAFGELCLRKIEGKWVLSYFDNGNYNITVRVFDQPTSDLSAAHTYVPIRGGWWGNEDDTTVAQLYGGYIHPDSTLHNLHLIVSQWNTQTGWPYRAMQFVTGLDE